MTFNKKKLFITGISLLIAGASFVYAEAPELIGTITGYDIDGWMSAPRGIAVRDNEIYVLDGINKDVKIYSDEGVLKYQFDLLQTGSPKSIAVDSDKNVYVTDLYGPVKVYDYRGEPSGNLNLSYTGNTVNRIIYISIDKKDRFYVVPQSRKTIYRFSRSGKFEKKIGHEAGDIKNIAGLAVDDSGNVYISDQRAYKVRVYSPGGEEIRSFGRPGQKPGTFSIINTLAVDSKRRVWVLDSTKQMAHVFDNEGKFLFFVNAPSPSSIKIDNGRVYVSSETYHGVLIFKVI